MTEQSIWKYACLRDLQVPRPRHVSFSWKQLYVSAFDGTHSYSFRQQEKHIDWIRIGAFFFDSPVALLMENLGLPKTLPRIEDDAVKCIQDHGCCLLPNIKTGIWIADLQLVRCPVCNLNSCEGTMQILDARHAELFLEEGYKSGAWKYYDIGSLKIAKPCRSATGVIIDLKHLNSCGRLFDVKSWVGAPSDWQPKATLCLHAVAVNTNLQPNDGLNVKFQAMRSSGADEKVVSIRISQQLI
ncbi:uncharacterized protein A4U43_C01F26000 [Asparagus officinalis]|uniref:Uncharacterized protein n=2 Tax=Asparagus officinalis TaxID=4686 RepID=A0A5P1FSH0_ASPOF|nr:uncharacterized protein A4U43_C01F26000 [Asparagus officinalis]